jgi:manganese/zinc/iron transport system permease protein
MNIIIDYTIWVIMIGTAVLGCVSGALGSFAVLRKQSLLGDAISHAALPGIGIAFLITQSKSANILLLGAFTAGLIGSILVMLIVKNTVIKEDSALGIILSVFFGIGLVILTMIQKMPNASQSGLTTFLFGSAATILKNDIQTMAIVGAIAVSILMMFWKQFKLISFDPHFAATQSIPVKKMEILLTVLMVAAIVIGLQTVGVVLMSAMVIAPAASARQWTNKLGKMVTISALFGALSGIIGVAISASYPKVPTGPIIVIVMSVIVVISLILGSAQGLLWEKVRKK